MNNSAIESMIITLLLNYQVTQLMANFGINDETNLQCLEIFVQNINMIGNMNSRLHKSYR